ncbi:MAG: GNAT family N-acetyltransferase, partial [Actinomycetota bacterium]|nr:GNAT family N-acetyltransferase [Actinomycetota bacterium]
MPRDAPAVARIGRAALPAQYAGQVDVGAIDAAVEQTYSDAVVADCIRRCADAQDAHFLVAEHEGRIAGFLHFDCFGREPELHRLYVSAQDRGHGAGRLLMDALHERLGPQGAYMLLVVAGNDRAIRFYEREGLRVAEEVDGLAYYREHMGVEFPPGTPSFALLV